MMIINWFFGRDFVIKSVFVCVCVYWCWYEFSGQIFPTTTNDNGF